MKKIAIAATTAMLVLSVGAFAGCSPSTEASDDAASQPAAETQAAEEEESDADEAESTEVAAEVGTPLPADHEGRLESMDADQCSACHGATDETGTPATPDAKANPEDHYVDDSYATGEINDAHQDCGACHAES